MPSKVIKKFHLDESKLIKKQLYTDGSLFEGLTPGPLDFFQFNLAREFPTALVGVDDNYPVPNKLNNLFDSSTNIPVRLTNLSGRADNNGLRAEPLSPNSTSTPRKGYLIFDLGRKIKPRKLEIVLHGADTAFTEDSDFQNGFINSGGLRVYFQNSLDNLDLLASEGGTSTALLQNNAFIEETISAGQEDSFRVVSAAGVESTIGDDEDYVIKRLTLDEIFPFTPGGLFDDFQFMILEFQGSKLAHTFDLREISLFEEVDLRDYNVEFDDALLELEGWKNPRFKGSKLTGKKINEFNQGDISYGKNPVVERKTTALYITDSCISAEDEDLQFAFIEGHSYVGIKQILIINQNDNTVQIIDKSSENFDVFQKFITSDFPTGGKLKVRVVDEAIQHNLKNDYFVKFNKGTLLSSFRYFKYENDLNDVLTFKDGSTPFGSTNGEPDGSNSFGPTITRPSVAPLELSDTAQLQEGTFMINLDPDPNGDNAPLPNVQTFENIGGEPEVERLFFRIGAKDDDPLMLRNDGSFHTDNQPNYTNSTNSLIQLFEMVYAYFQNTFVSTNQPTFSNLTDPDYGLVGSTRAFSPSYTNSIVKKNKFTTQYYSSSFSEQPFGNFNAVGPEGRFDGAHFKASKFILQDTLKFLKENQTTTELHLTLMSGSVDFAPGLNDERSIGTFEVSPFQSFGALNEFTNVNDYPFLELKARKEDGRFMPKLTPRTRTTKHYIATGSLTNPMIYQLGGTIIGVPVNPSNFVVRNHGFTQTYTRNIYYNDADAASDNGISESVTEDLAVTSVFSGTTLDTLIPGNIGNNAGSYGITYELSFLDKSPTVILDIDKEAELFDGSGEKGLLLIPEHLEIGIKDNIDFYLRKAGIIERRTIKAPPRPERGR